jgi:hypothetical protein
MSIANLLIENTNLIHANDIISDSLDTYFPKALDLGTITANRVNIGTNAHQIPLYINGALYNAGSVTSIGPVGAAPNANGGLINANTLVLEPASITYPGVVTALDQTVSGIKTFQNGIIVSPVVSDPNIINVFSRQMHENLGAVTFTGAGVTLGAACVIQVTPAMGFISFGTSNASTGTGGILTMTQIVKPDLRCGSIRSFMVNVMNNGVYIVGGGRISSTGVVTIGKGYNASSGLIGFDAGVTQILDSSSVFSMA